jgi:DNA (cytosine-5)-methyltransferase 1
MDGSEVFISRRKGKNLRKITPREASRLQGLPDSFMIPVSDVQAYRQIGNSVAVPAIKVVAKQIIPHIRGR